MEKNKTKIIIPLIIIFTLLIFTIYKIVKNHEGNLYKAFYGEIKYAAKQCFLKKECEESTTLQNLYDKKYLEIQYDPVTKELLNPETIIEYKEEKIDIKFK